MKTCFCRPCYYLHNKHLYKNVYLYANNSVVLVRCKLLCTYAYRFQTVFSTGDIDVAEPVFISGIGQRSFHAPGKGRE